MELIKKSYESVKALSTAIIKLRGSADVAGGKGSEVTDGLNAARWIKGAAGYLLKYQTTPVSSSFTNDFRTLMLQTYKSGDEVVEEYVEEREKPLVTLYTDEIRSWLKGERRNAILETRVTPDEGSKQYYNIVYLALAAVLEAEEEEEEDDDGGGIEGADNNAIIAEEGGAQPLFNPGISAVVPIYLHTKIFVNGDVQSHRPLIAELSLMDVSRYQDITDRLHTTWSIRTGRRERPNILDITKSWPGYQVLFFRLQGEVGNEPTEPTYTLLYPFESLATFMTDIKYVEVRNVAFYVPPTEDIDQDPTHPPTPDGSIPIYLCIPELPRQALATTNLSSMVDFSDFCVELHEIWMAYLDHPLSVNEPDLKSAWPRHELEYICHDGCIIDPLTYTTQEYIELLNDWEGFQARVTEINAYAMCDNFLSF